MFVISVREKEMKLSNRIWKLVWLFNFDKNYYFSNGTLWIKDINYYKRIWGKE